jgi:glycosyltransferase involved in cell wall biosynthesis
MKILVLSREFPPYVLGGISYHLRSLYAEVADRGHDVTVLAGRCPQSWRDEGATVPPQVQVDPVEFGYRKGYYVLYPLALRAKLRAVETAEYDVAVAHTPLPFGVGDLPLATKYHDCVAETREHMREGLSLPDRIGDSLLQPFRSAIDRRSLRESDFAIFTSRVNKGGWEAHYDVDVDNTIVHNAVDTDTFYPRDVETQDYVVFVGATEQKGLSAVLDYADEGRRPVHVVGARRVDHPDVVWHGRVSQDRLAEIYSGAAATIHPARFESFGNIVLESLACGTPSVTTPRCGASELLTPETGVVTTDLACGVRQAVDMDAADCRAVAEGHQWSDVARETIEVLRGLARGDGVDA